MRPTFQELTEDIEYINENLKETQEAIDNADNAYELADLVIQLDFYECALLLAEEVMADTIDKGNGD